MLTLCHLSRLIETQAAKYGQKTALAHRDSTSGKWVPVSWNQFSETVATTAKAMLSIGIEPQERVAIFSQNMPNCFYVDFACYGIRAITIPFYATSSSEQANYMITDAEVRTIFVGEQRQYDTILPLLSISPTLERIIIFDKKVVRHPSDRTSLYFDEFLDLGKDEKLAEELEKRKQDAKMEDICNILYTSGTTGNSKGVVLTYSMYDNAILENSRVLPISDKDICLNFLPFTHVFERGCSYLCLSLGACQVVNQNPADALKSMQEIRPTCMCAVPRFWEKIYEGVVERIQGGNSIKRKLFNSAMAFGARVQQEYYCKGLPLPKTLKFKHAIYDKLVYSVIRKTLGLDRGNIFPTAGATISKDIETFVHTIGICMIAGYGLTETTATVSCDIKGGKFTIGSVGRVIGGIELKISDEGEILLRGKSVTPRYYRKPKATAETIDEEGWFHTGDAGYIKDGELYLTDRIKDLYKTSNGKYIAPQQIESKLIVDKYIDQIVIIADRYKYVSAIIVPSYTMLEKYANDHNISFSTREELCSNTAINEMLMERIETLQQGLAKYEQVKRFVLLPQPFSMERGEMTNTLKVKRKVVFERYANLIEEMYK